MTKTEQYEQLCEKVISTSSDVRFAGVVNSKGEMISGRHGEHVEPLLSEDDVKMSIHYALQKRDLYTNLAYKIGVETSSITEYEKVTMINIPINSNELFLISTEPRADYMKILDFVRSNIDAEQT